MSRYRDKTHHAARTSAHQFGGAALHIIQIYFTCSFRACRHITSATGQKRVGRIDRLHIHYNFLIHI
ncbi:unknown [Bacteroides sp. CAG:1060]|nr:unknown [Bacteroides sp. CAG:1060]